MPRFSDRGIVDGMEGGGRGGGEIKWMVVKDSILVWRRVA